MARNGMEFRARARLIAGNVRGARSRAAGSVATPAHRPLAEVVPLRRPLPDLEHPPTTRAIDEDGRIRLRSAGRDVGDVVGWSPGVLVAVSDGDWVVLRPAAGSTARRNDGGGRFCADGRLRLSVAVREQLGLGPGDEVFVLPLPSSASVALCHPARLLTGAPLSLVGASPDDAAEGDDGE